MMKQSIQMPRTTMKDHTECQRILIFLPGSYYFTYAFYGEGRQAFSRHMSPVVFGTS